MKVSFTAALAPTARLLARIVDQDALPADLPVPRDWMHTMASPRAAVRLFLHAAGMDTAAIGPRLPGWTSRASVTGSPASSDGSAHDGGTRGCRIARTHQ